MGDLHEEGPESQRRPSAREREVAARAQTIPAGVSNHLLARALSASDTPAAATLARVFQHKGKEVPKDAKVPRIHGASLGDLQKLADDEHDYGAITDAGSVAAAMVVYEQNHRVVVALPALDETYAGYETVFNDDDFDDHLGTPVRATFQLDSMQGKHDDEFASGKDARKKSGGEKMPEDADYEELAQGVPAALTRPRLAQIFAKPERVPLNFSVQKTRQADGYHYEISAMWATLPGPRLHVLVFYHCYPPR